MAGKGRSRVAKGARISTKPGTHAIAAGVAVAATGAVLARRHVMKKKYPKMAEGLRSKIMAAQKAGDFNRFYALKTKLAKVSAAYGVSG